MSQADPRAKRVVSLFENLRSDRGRWESVWRKVGQFVSPARHVERGNLNIPIDRTKIYDNTAPEAAFELASILFGTLTSPATKWLTLDIDSDRQGDIEWKQSVELMLMKQLRDPAVGFETAMAELYFDLVTFGTACQSVMEDTKSIFRFRTYPIGECYLAEDNKGVVDTVIRRFDFTAQQAVGMWNPALLSQEVQDILNGEGRDAEKRLSEKREYLHAIFPRDDASPMVPPSRTGMPFASFWVDVKSGLIVSEGGFREFPFLCPRMFKTPGHVYGESPAINVIEEIMMANTERRTNIAVKEKAADPAMVLEDNSVIGPIRTRPGALVYKRPGSGPIEQLPTGDPRVNEASLEESRRFIREAFLLDKLNLPMQDRMTATEVVERRRDALQVLSPFTSRMLTEHLAPAVTRIIAINSRRGLLPPVPDGVTRMDVRYVSPLAVSQRAGEVQAVTSWLNLLSTPAQFDPSVLLAVNTDELAQGTGISLNVPQRYINPPEVVSQIRQEQQQREQIAQAAQAAPGVADAVKTVAETQQLLPQ